MHFVREGETPASIAAEHGIDAQHLVAANLVHKGWTFMGDGAATFAQLRPGEPLLLPHEVSAAHLDALLAFLEDVRARMSDHDLAVLEMGLRSAHGEEAIAHGELDRAMAQLHAAIDATVRAGFIGDEISDLEATSPEFKKAIADVEAQAKAEGFGAGDVTAQKQLLYDSFKSIYQNANFDVKNVAQAVDAARAFVKNNKSIGGAIAQIQGVVQDIQSGAPPAQTMQAVTGALVALLIAGNVIAPGIGAAITAGIGVVATFLQGVGLLPSGPQGVQIPGCAGVTVGSTPTYQVGCVVTWGQVSTTPGSSAWRRFPDQNKPEDALWFKPIDAIRGWAGGKWYGDDWANLYPGRRMIDNAWFGSYRWMECEMRLPGVAGEFQRAFIGAWKANAELALNGLKPAEDWQVLLHTLRTWNRARLPAGASAPTGPGSQSFAVPPPLTNEQDAAVRYLASQVGFGADLSKTPPVCPANLPPYFTTLIDTIRHQSPSDLIADQLVIAGDQFNPKGLAYATLGGATSKGAARGASTGAVVGVAAAVATGGLFALWWALGKPASWAAFKHAWRHSEG